MSEFYLVNPDDNPKLIRLHDGFYQVFNDNHQWETSAYWGGMFLFDEVFDYKEIDLAELNQSILNRIEADSVI